MGFRQKVAMAPGLALALAACGGPPALELAADPVQRAAQCGVVATTAARSAQTDVKADLPFATQVQVLHYALLAATDGNGGYDQARAGAVLKALPQAEPTVTEGQWQALVPACEAAFPHATAPARLPDGALDAQLGCALLADYVEGALQSQEVRYATDLQPIRQMRLGLDNRIGARLHQAGAADAEAQQAPRDRAMDRIVRAGAAAPMLATCVERFPGGA